MSPLCSSISAISVNRVLIKRMRMLVRAMKTIALNPMNLCASAGT